MDLVLKRTKFEKDGIFSELLLNDGSFFCYTLEHAYGNQDETVFVPKIYNGIFKCVRGIHQLEKSPRPFETFEITEVAGHTNILFHTGNFNTDSEGCVLVGESILTNKNGLSMLADSRLTFDRFMRLQSQVNEFSLLVVDYIFNGWSPLT